MNVRTSVVIPTRNGMPLIKACLEAVARQETFWAFEIIVIDSGSTDGTWEFARSRADVAVQIHPSDFNHGATRNYGAQLARGKFLVFLVQDAIPVNEVWLASLVEACAPERVAGSYSRHQVRNDSKPITFYIDHNTTPSGQAAVTKAVPDGHRLCDLAPRERLSLSSFADVSSCIKREVWEKYPLHPVPYGEDVEWGKRVIEAGYALAYEPTSTVCHSHDRSPWYNLKRSYADHFLASELFGYVMIPTWRKALRSAVWSVLNAWSFSREHRFERGEAVRLMLAALPYAVCLAVGQYLGPRMQRSGCRPRWAKRLDELLRRGV